MAVLVEVKRLKVKRTKPPRPQDYKGDPWALFGRALCAGDDNDPEAKRPAGTRRLKINVSFS